MLAWGALFAGGTWDDAYITFRFSDHWARLGTLTWNPGEAPVEGSTSLAFTAIGAAIQRLTGIRAHLAMPVVSLVCWLAAMGWVLPSLLRRILPSSARVRFWLLSAACVNGSLAFHFFHGLETSLHVLNLLLALWLADPDRPMSWRRAAGLSLVTVLGCLTRPDAAVFLGVLWVIVLIQHRSRWRGVIAGGGIGFLLLVAIESWKAHHFGSWVPNTFHVKGGSGWSGLGYVAVFFAWCLPLLAAAGGGISRKPDRWWILCLIPSLAQAAAFTRLDPILGGVFRFLIAVWLPLFLAGTRGIHLMTSRRLRTWGTIALCAGALAMGARVIKQTGRWHAYADGCRRLAQVGRHLEAAARYSPPPVLGTGDVGAIPYFSGLNTFDLIGLCSREVAVDGLTHDLLDRKRPDLMILQDIHPLPAGQTGTIPIPHAEGAPLFLDLARYAHLPKDPSRHHRGDGADMMVLTWPAFNAEYRFVRRIKISSSDYWVFVRAAYPHAAELAGLCASLPDAP